MGRRRRRPPLAKSTNRLPVRPEATFSAEQVQALLGQRQAGPLAAAPLPRRDPQVPFGPGVPVPPAAIDPARESSGRPEPRIYEYPVTINLPNMTDRLVPWKVLRDAAEMPVVRDCIRIRKNELTSLEWDIVVSKRALAQQRRANPDMSSVALERELRARLEPDAARLLDFWQHPDWQQGETFVEWATKLMEEHLVLDALAIYPFRDQAGQRLGLRILDGSTVKVLRDHLGGRPMPPSPAYQQVLWGFPRGEFVADVDPDTGKVPNAYDSDRLIYKRREVRTITPYGYSCVEQALQDADLYLRRLEWDKAQYTDGVQPAGWIVNEGMESWTPQQIVDYNRAFNDLYAGQTLTRMRYHLLPPGMKPSEATDVPEKFKPDYHLHLIKLVAMHFDVTLAELGFTESKGLGSSGYHEGQENVQERKATNPTLTWLQAVLTEISRTHLAMPAELEFRFLGLDAEDQAAADAVLQEQVRSGRITINEAREEAGRAPFHFDEANMPIVQTTRGIVFIENASRTVVPGLEVQPPQEPDVADIPPHDLPGPAQHVPAQPPSPLPPVSPGGRPPGSTTTAASSAKGEVIAYWKWATNGRKKGRKFEFHHLTPSEAMLHDIDLNTAVFTTTLSKAGGVPGKAPRRPWPAWQQDRAVAVHWATVLRQALRGAPSTALATRWLAIRKASGTEAQRRDAAGWLASVGFSLTPLIQRVLHGLYVDAFYLGDTSAQALLAGAEHVDWTGFTPGNTAATRQAIGAQGHDPALQQLLTDARRVAGGINATRLAALAAALAAAVDTQPTADELSGQLDGILDSASAAATVSTTETSRGVNAGALAVYAATGLFAGGARGAHGQRVGLYWQTEDDARVCAVCLANEAASPVEPGALFPSGDQAAPAHPACRCFVYAA